MLAGLALPNCNRYHRWHSTMVEELEEVAEMMEEGEKVENASDPAGHHTLQTGFGLQLIEKPMQPGKT